MKTRHICALVLAVVTVCRPRAASPSAGAVTAASFTPQDQSIVVQMIGKAGAPPHIAVPLFATLTGDAATQDAARALTDVLSADLTFEREFDVMPPASYAGIPSAQSIEDLPYDRWTQFGADYVAVGSVTSAGGGHFDVELRVVSVKSQRQEYGARFDAPSVRSLRRLAHTFSDEMHKAIRGIDGIARTRIAFSSTRDAEHLTNTGEDRSAKEIYVMDYDGQNQTKITTNRSLNLFPSWCPDNQCLAYMTYAKTGFPDIALQTVFGRIGVNYPTHGTAAVHNYLPKISPDGTLIAYGSTRNGEAMDVYVSRRDGSDERRLTNSPASEGTPAWAPSGNIIAFTSDRASSVHPKIYTMNADGTGVKRVENDCAHCDRPTFAPGDAGLLLAYATQTGAGFDIETYDMSTGQLHRITDGQGTNESPSFAPNGRHIVFSTTRWGKAQLAIVDIDGRNVRQLTFAGRNTSPDWSGFPK
jgi:TolB protein